MAVEKRSYDGNMLSVLAVWVKHESVESAEDGGRPSGQDDSDREWPLHLLHYMTMTHTQSRTRRS